MRRHEPVRLGLRHAAAAAAVLLLGTVPLVVGVTTSRAAPPTTPACVANLDRQPLRLQRVHGDGRVFSFPRTVVIERSARLVALARALCALPPLPADARACPVDFLLHYALKTAEQRVPIRIDPSGCQTVRGLGTTRWAATRPRFWTALGDAIGLAHATIATFRGDSARPAVEQRCSTDGLTIRMARSFAGLSHVGGYITFTNRTWSPCRLSGWPTLTAVTRSVALHTQIRWVPDKNLTRIPVVTPQHGDSAYAVFAGDDNYGQGQTHPLADVERRVRELHAAELAIARDDEEHRNNRGRAARLTTARV